jgi:tRNA pseudouridine55 synthase
MNGILNVLKPPGMTSFDVIAYLRGVLKIRKIGHSGTLDPGAVGVLPVFINKATRAIEFAVEKDKLYRAELTLGVSTDTQDSTGKIVDRRDIRVSEKDIFEVMSSFKGRINQVPPMHSAIKQDGIKLYDLTRSGVTVKRKAREIEIYSIRIINISDCRRILFDVACSKGTYVRTLCADIGERLGCGGHMSFLIRLRSGMFGIGEAVTLEEIERLTAEGKLEEALVGVERIFKDMASISLGESDTVKFLNGIFLHVEENSFKQGELVSVYSGQGSLIALGEIVSKENGLFLKSKKSFSAG